MTPFSARVLAAVQEATDRGRMLNDGDSDASAD